MIRSLSLLTLLLIAPALVPELRAQAAAPAPAHPVVIAVPPANAGDVASIDAIIAALYDVISGGVGEERDWNRMRSLFIPGGRLLPTGARQGGGIGIRPMEPNDYIALSGDYLVRIGFREREIFRRQEQFGHIAHVFSTYEGVSEADGNVIRGINSIQLMNDGARWWIVSVFWEAESPTNPLPAQYLPPR